MSGQDEMPGQSGLKRSPKGHPNFFSPVIFFSPGSLGFNSQSGKSLRRKAEDKGSKANADKSPRGTEGHRNEVGGGGRECGGTEGGKGTIARTVIVTTTIATTDTPMSPRGSVLTHTTHRHPRRREL